MKLHYILLRAPQLSISKNWEGKEIMSELKPTKSLLSLLTDLEHLDILSKTARIAFQLRLEVGLC